MKVRIRANKLEGADVGYISLVERGAIRSPFKVMKEDKGAQTMIDLSRVLKGDAKSTVVGFVVEKADKEVAAAALKAAGLPTDKVVEFEDGTIVVKQDDTDLAAAKNVVAIKMADDFVLLVKGFDPYSYCEGMGFNDIIKSQGFMPGLSMGMDALGQTVRQALMTATDQKDAVSKIGDALDAFAEYTNGLASSIPTTAFKAAEEFRKQKDAVAKGFPAAKPDAEDLADGGKDEAKEKAKAKAKKEEAVAALPAEQKAHLDALIDDAAKDAFLALKPEERVEAVEVQKSYVNMTTDEKKYHDALPTHERGAFAKSKPEARKEFMSRNKSGAPVNSRKDDAVVDMAAITAAIAEGSKAVLSKVTEVVNGAVEGVKKELGTKIDAVAATAAEAKEQALKTEKIVKGTVRGVPAGDNDEEEVVVKQGTGMIDTAFKNVRKNEFHSGVRRFGRHAN